jgi:DNA-binding transcriptional MocR family regulator
MVSQNRRVNGIIVSMTSWEPRLAHREGPRYLAIADALGEDIEGGRLAPGDRLPTHRDLADAIGVTVGTVTRAYREAENRGLVTGQVGRGTFVRRHEGPPRAPSLQIRDPRERDVLDLSLNFMPMPDGEILVPQMLAELARDPAVALLLEEYCPQAGTNDHRDAGATFVARAGISASPEQILVCAGAQHAMTVALMGLTRPGDILLTEEVTYPAILALARVLHLDVRGLPMDEDGLRPDALEDFCARHRPRVLYCMPTLHNPTTRTMPLARRQEIARIVSRHGFAVLEDDVYGFLLDDAPPPLTTLVGHRGYFLTSCSKSIAPGLRVGYLVVPKGDDARFLDALWATTVMAPPLMAEIASRWIRDGTAATLVRARQVEAKARQQIAREYLGGQDVEAHRAGYHAWLRLPPPWQSTHFVTRVLQRGVAVTPCDTFAVERQPQPAVRIGLGAAPSREALREGLEVIADELAGSHHLRVV